MILFQPRNTHQLLQHKPVKGIKRISVSFWLRLHFNSKKVESSFFLPPPPPNRTIVLFTALNNNNNTFIFYFIFINLDYVGSRIFFIRHKFYVCSEFKSYSGDSADKPLYKNRLKSPITQRTRLRNRALDRRRATPGGHLVEKALSLCKVHGKLKCCL